MTTDTYSSRKILNPHEIINESINTTHESNVSHQSFLTKEGAKTPHKYKKDINSPTHQQKDLRGCPSHDMCHTKSHPSLLSHSNKNINLRGLYNLLLIIVFVQNARLVIENFMKYGVRIQLFPPTSVNDLIENWPILLTLILMQFIFFLAYFIEKYVNPILTSNALCGYTVLNSIITWGNAALVLFIPYYTVRVYEVEPVAASLLLAFSITWFFKLWSFHHVMIDVRYSLKHNEPFDAFMGGRKAEKYPHSLNFKEFYIFLIMPTMCFQFEYPRSTRIRWVSAIRHLGEMLGGLILIKIMIEQYMVVIVQNTFIPIEEFMTMTIVTVFAHLSERILKLSIPNLYVWLLMFFSLFHHWLNFLAEITQFADRDFYHDWWNSSSFEEYWKKWNLPIHNFLNRHVNKPLLRSGVPKLVASPIIFIISALAHEYLVCVPLHVGWTGLIFTCFMAQIPLIYLTSKQFFIDYPTAGNVIFWILFCFTGQPLAIIVYYYLWGVKHGSVTEVGVKEIQHLVAI